MNRFRPNRRLAEDFERTRAAKAAKVKAAERIAQAVRAPTRYGYEADVVERGDTVVVTGTTDTRPYPIAGWLEYGGDTGQGTIPALRVLGNAARKAGYKLKENARK